ncbi:kinase-like domain-containing protein [Lasiosphaeria miniovina]|uniref:non-specific serine/threonine protein kinase n=1 Tax=Lasiosphaeria miniovina TaxID=1954250 RepID=A0AA40A5F4_9PEZI|nr:kinase-like domain-containing protein [Lasiosphaeria miniovina]KAK0709607.1 kinase-like domain-containing protein [Lasiosphaeria miniovina]
MATSVPAGADGPMRSQSVRTRRPPTSSRAEPLPRSESSSKAESSRPHRRSSQRSTSAATSPRHAPQPEMAGHSPTPAPAPNMAVAPDDHRDSAGGHRQPKHRYRAAIPAPSGNYTFMKTIGQGSMGKVKLAKKEGTNEFVACKIIERVTPDDGRQTREEREKTDSAREDRNAREAAIVSLLSHKYICALHDNLRTRWHWYMLFEYVNGGQMLDYIISHGKLKEKQARKFARQIASAVDYCHRNSIVHRDLKIENILISKTGDIKIIDFGLSNLFSPEDDRKLKTYCGSLYFAAPELLQAKPYTGPEVDVWSFGVVLFVLVCGKVPFDDQYMPALHQKIKKGAVDYPNWLTSECKNLISRMLVTDPKQRATMYEVMNHPWMLKGYGAPPDNYLPHREPLALPLDAEVIDRMTGFKFGPPEYIRDELTRKIKSPKYQAAVRRLERERDIPQPTQRDAEKRRGFGFDFYKRRNSVTSKETLTNTSSEGLSIGDDPLNAFDPMISIYYLVREKLERERKEPQQPSKAHQPSSPQQSEAPPVPPSPIARPREKHSLAEIVPPQPTHVTEGRTRQRARSHSEDQAREPVKNGLLSPDMIPVKKESTAAGIFRRLSTRDRRKEPPPPTTPTESKPNTLIRGSVSMRAKSLGHARRESIQARRARREAEREQQPVKEETDAELGGDGDGDGEGETSGGSHERLEQDPDLAKPVYLKGIFSVSTTSTKPLLEIRADIKRVLKQIGVDYTEIRGGFSCRHSPSLADDPSQPEPTVADGEIKFEILIVKVPIVSLHGVQFKRVAGNTWNYKTMAEQIVRELRL